MLFWMVYVAVVTLILGCAALAGERSAQIRKAPTRWVWAASLVASLVLPVVMSSVSIQVPRLSGPTDDQAAPRAAVPLRQMAIGAVQPSAWLDAEAGHVAARPDVDTLLTWSWRAASGLMLLAILGNGALLHRRKRAWARQTLAGAQVLVSEDVGPAVVGLLRPCIVVPRWIVGAEPQTQTLVMAHEQSHLDADDARLLAVAILLIIAMPWNLPLWWQLRRLRFAIEMDCDARVLKGGHDVAVYGETLVMVGERQSAPLAVVAAMSEPRSFLEQRIHKMLQKKMKFAWASATALAGLGFVLAAGAAEVSPPNAALPQAVSHAASHPAGGQMKRYQDRQWNFALDVPKSWNAFPPQPGVNAGEVIRFASRERGSHLLLISRDPHDPQVSPAAAAAAEEQHLAKIGFSHFVTGETRIGSRVVHTLDFEKPIRSGVVWSCRSYVIVDGTLSYTLGFGTTDPKGMFGLFDRMAKSFVFGDPEGQGRASGQ